MDWCTCNALPIIEQDSRGFDFVAGRSVAITKFRIKCNEKSQSNTKKHGRLEYSNYHDTDTPPPPLVGRLLIHTGTITTIIAAVKQLRGIHIMTIQENETERANINPHST